MRGVYIPNLGPHAPTPAPMGWNLARWSRPNVVFAPNLTHINATCRPSGAINLLQINPPPPRVTEIPALRFFSHWSLYAGCLSDASKLLAVVCHILGVDYVLVVDCGCLVDWRTNERVLDTHIFYSAKASHIANLIDNISCALCPCFLGVCFSMTRSYIFLYFTYVIPGICFVSQFAFTRFCWYFFLPQKKLL